MNLQSHIYACSLFVPCISDIPGAVRELFRSFLHCSLSMWWWGEAPLWPGRLSPSLYRNAVLHRIFVTCVTVCNKLHMNTKMHFTEIQICTHTSMVLLVSPCLSFCKYVLEFTQYCTPLTRSPGYQLPEYLNCTNTALHCTANLGLPAPNITTLLHSTITLCSVTLHCNAL